METLTNNTHSSPHAGSHLNLIPVHIACKRYPHIFPTEKALRSLIFRAHDRHSSHGVIKGNGLDVALIKLGRKILIDEDKLIGWIYSHHTSKSFK